MPEIEISETDLPIAQQFLNEEQPDLALAICDKVLDRDPDNYGAVFMAGHALLKAERWGAAYQYYRRATHLQPWISHGWNNLGRCLQELDRYDEAEASFKRAIYLDPDNFAAYNNLLQSATVGGRAMEAVYWFGKAMEKVSNADEMAECRMNVAMPMLALRRWEDGWKNYEYGLGRHKTRPDYSLTGEGRWQGPGGKRQTVVLYAEQGLGEEILFGSMIPDAMQDMDPIIECDPRMVTLFKEAFGCPVFGTRFSKDRSWATDHRIDAHLAMGSLGQWYRRNGEFPRTPYFGVHRGSRLRSGPKLIGVAWTGGKRNTGGPMRSLPLQTLEPIFATGCNFVSLQYRDAKDEIAASGFPIQDVPEITQSSDYANTASLVATLDSVVCVTTAVAHLAGALGVECHVLVPERPQWHWGVEGEFPWFKSVKLHRQVGGSWEKPIAEIAEVLRGS